MLINLLGEIIYKKGQFNWDPNKCINNIVWKIINKPASRPTNLILTFHNYQLPWANRNTVILKKKEYRTGRGVNRHKGICYSSDVVQNFNSLTGTCNWMNWPLSLPEVTNGIFPHNTTTFLSRKVMWRNKNVTRGNIFI